MNPMKSSRPDVALAMSIVSRYSHHQSVEHLQLANYWDKYLGGTQDFGLELGGQRELPFLQ